MAKVVPGANDRRVIGETVGRRLAVARLIPCALLVLASCTGEGWNGGRPRPGQQSAKELAAAAALLPPYLHAPLALDSILSDDYLGRSTTVACLAHDSAGRELRRTIRGNLADRTGVVVFARAAAADSALRRVEVVRRPPDDAQMGFIWDATSDTAEVVTYPRSGGEMGRRIWYHGGPIAARLQQIGRKAIGVKCKEAGKT